MKNLVMDMVCEYEPVNEFVWKVLNDFVGALRYAIVEKMNAEDVARIWARDFDRIEFRYKNVLRPHIVRFLFSGDAETFKNTLLTVIKWLTTDALIEGARKIVEKDPELESEVALFIHGVGVCLGKKEYHTFLSEAGYLRIKAIIAEEPLREWDFEDFEYRVKFSDAVEPGVCVERIGGWPIL
ncbi:MAG: hypothetical protein J7J61_07100 [Candidatus Hydrothermae bacterium]|nr:hypothetical protein [Candidatus Hydrothermae bacterium]